MKKMGLVVLLVCLSVGCLAAEEPSWNDWQFILGEWIGEGSGIPGQGSGGFTFLPDLGEHVLIRKSHADYPATDKQPAFSHHDLMVVYEEAARLRADYFDTEGHVIHYTVELAASHDAATFTSDPTSTGQQFRLRYGRKTDNQIAIKFEIAPPGQPFSTYLEATAHRK
jgi:hypothetical protein